MRSSGDRSVVWWDSGPDVAGIGMTACYCEISEGTCVVCDDSFEVSASFESDEPDYYVTSVVPC